MIRQHESWPWTKIGRKWKVLLPNENLDRLPDFGYIPRPRLQGYSTFTHKFQSLDNKKQLQRETVSKQHVCLQNIYIDIIRNIYRYSIYIYVYINASCQNHRHHSAIAEKLKKNCQLLKVWENETTMRLSWDHEFNSTILALQKPQNSKKSSRAMAKQAVAC